MVKRYSDLNRAKVNANVNISANLGRVDDKASTQFLQNVKSTADTFADIAINNAKRNALEQAKDSALASEIVIENGLPVYNPILDGGDVYNAKYEEIYNKNYVDTLTTSFDKKIVETRKTFLDDPKNQFDAIPLLNSMNDIRSSMLSEVPQQFQNIFSNYSMGKINQVFNAESQQVATALNNSNKKSLLTRITNFSKAYEVEPSEENEKNLKDQIEDARILLGPDLSKVVIQNINDSIASTKDINNLKTNLYGVNESNNGNLQYNNSTDALIKLQTMLTTNGKNISVELDLGDGKKEYTKQDLSSKFLNPASLNAFLENNQKAITLRNKTNDESAQLAMNLDNIYTSYINGQSNSYTTDDIDTAVTNATDAITKITEDNPNFLDSNKTSKMINDMRNNILRQSYQNKAKIEDAKRTQSEKQDRQNLLRYSLFNPANEDWIKDYIEYKNTYPDAVLSQIEQKDINYVRTIFKNLDVKSLSDENIATNLRILSEGIKQNQDSTFYLTDNETIDAKDLKNLGVFRGDLKSYIESEIKTYGSKSTTDKQNKINGIIKNIKDNIKTSSSQKQTNEVFNVLLSEELGGIDISDDATAARILSQFNNPQIQQALGNVFEDLDKLDQFPSVLKSMFDYSRYTNLKTVMEQSLPMAELLENRNPNLYNKIKDQNKGIIFLEYLSGMNIEVDDQGNYSDTVVAKLQGFQDLYNDTDKRQLMNKTIVNAINPDKADRTENFTNQLVVSQITDVAKEIFKDDPEKGNIFNTNITEIVKEVYANILPETFLFEHDDDTIKDNIKNTLVNKINNYVPLKDSIYLNIKKKNTIDTRIANAPNISKTNNSFDVVMGVLQQKLVSKINKSNVLIDNQQPSSYELLNDIPFEKITPGVYLGNKKGQELKKKDFNTTITQKHNLYPTFDNASFKTVSDVFEANISIDGKETKQSVILGRNAKLNIIKELVLPDGSTQVTATVILRNVDKESGTITNDPLIKANGEQFLFVYNKQKVQNEINSLSKVHSKDTFIKNKIKLLEDDVKEDKNIEATGKTKLLEDLKYQEFNNAGVAIENISNANNYINMHRNNLLITEPNQDGYTETVKGTIITVDVPVISENINQFLKEDQTNMTQTMNYLVPSKRLNASGELEDVPADQIFDYALDLGLENLVSDTSIIKLRDKELKIKAVINNDNKIHDKNKNKKNDLSIFTDKAFGEKVTIDAINAVLDITDEALPSSKPFREQNYKWLFGTANAESRLGKHELTFLDNKISRGIWQFDKKRTKIDEVTGEEKEIIPIFADLRDNKVKTSRLFRKSVQKIETAINKKYPDLDFKFSKLKHKDLSVPFYGALVARLFLLTVDPSIEYKTIGGASNLWKDKFNTPDGDGEAEGWAVLNNTLYSGTSFSTPFGDISNIGK